MKNMKNAAIIAGYWDRAANHNTEMQQYLAALEDMTGERHEGSPPSDAGRAAADQRGAGPVAGSAS